MKTRDKRLLAEFWKQEVNIYSSRIAMRQLMITLSAAEAPVSSTAIVMSNCLPTSMPRGLLDNDTAKPRPQVQALTLYIFMKIVSRRAMRPNRN